MGMLSKLIAPECVVLNVDKPTKAEVIGLLVDTLKASGALADTKLLFKDIMKREELASTGLGFGCAVPHAHSAALDKTVVSVARLSHPLDFGSPDGELVRLVFLMAGPKDSAGLHLKLLSKLARLLHDPQLRQELMTVETADAFCQLICERDG